MTFHVNMEQGCESRPQDILQNYLTVKWVNKIHCNFISIAFCKEDIIHSLIMHNRCITPSGESLVSSIKTRLSPCTPSHSDFLFYPGLNFLRGPFHHDHLHFSGAFPKEWDKGRVLTLEAEPVIFVLGYRCDVHGVCLESRVHHPSSRCSEPG